MAKRKNKTEALQATKPSDPQDSGSRGMMLLPQRTAGVIVNEDTGMTQSTVWACIRVISESLAGMPWNVGRLTEDGTIDKIPDHPLTWVLNFAPNNETEAFTFRETLWAWALGWGNGYAEIERDLRGNPVALWQLHPSRVQPLRDDDGSLWYEVQNDMASPTYLPARDMFHLRGPSPDGLVGWSVIRMHARTIGLAIAQEDNAASYNANDSTPGGLLTTPQNLSEQARKNIEESWERRHGGPKNRRRVALLEADLKWQATGTDPTDSKLIEQMQLTPSMICRIFRVPPHKVADLTRSTNNNIEHQDLEFVKDTLRPWAERGEGEADLKMFGRNSQAKLVTVIDMSERERGDTASQTQHVKEMLFCGVYDVDEARRYLGMRPIGEAAGGSKRFVQSSMVLLKDVGLIPPSTPPQDTPVEDEEEEDTVDDEDATEDAPNVEDMAVRDAAMQVLADAFRRITARQATAKGLAGKELGDWRVKHRLYSEPLLATSASVVAALHSATPSLPMAVSTFLTSNELASEPAVLAAKFVQCLLAAAKEKAAA